MNLDTRRFSPFSNLNTTLSSTFHPVHINWYQSIIPGMATNTRKEALAKKVDKLDEKVCHYVGALHDIKVILATMASKHDRILSLLFNKAENEDSHDSNKDQNQNGNLPHGPIDDAAEEDEDTLAISIHAMSGYSSHQAMCMLGWIKLQVVSVLIDSGSTHNFISSKLSPLLDWPVHCSFSFDIWVADDNKHKKNKKYDQKDDAMLLRLLMRLVLCYCDPGCIVRSQSISQLKMQHGRIHSNYDSFFSHFDLEDKVSFEGGRNDKSPAQLRKKG